MDQAKRWLASVLLGMAVFGSQDALAQELVNPRFNVEEIRGRVGRLKDLMPRWQEAMDVMGVAGMAVAVVHDDKIVFTQTLGVRDPDQKLPVTPDTMFYIASCTKSYMAMGVLALAEEGRVDLDAPVKKYLPRFELADKEATESLTVRDLLSHAKGLSSGPIVFLDAYSGEVTEDRFYYWLRQEKPTGSFAYTNLHYTLLGRIAESVTGQSWKDFLAARVFEPAGMYATTGYAGKLYGSDNVAVPSEFDGERVAPAPVRKTDRVMHAAGGMGTSVSDAARWIRLNLAGGVIDGNRIVSGQSVHEMHRLQAAGEKRTRMPHRKREGYGLGWFVGSYHDIPMIDHGGGYIGTSASISLLPEYDLGVAVLANGSAPIAEVVATDVYTKLLDLPSDDVMVSLKPMAKRHMARIKERMAKDAGRPLTQAGLLLPIDSYVGTYVNDHWGSMVVAQGDGALSAKMGDLTLRMSSAEEDQFVADMGTGTSQTGTFVIEDKRVVALISKNDEYGQVRFERR